MTYLLVDECLYSIRFWTVTYLVTSIIEGSGRFGGLVMNLDLCSGLSDKLVLSLHGERHLECRKVVQHRLRSYVHAESSIAHVSQQSIHQVMYGKKIEISKLMMSESYSEIKHTSPFVAFLFARLRALVESSSDPLGAFSSSDSYPQIGGSVFGGSGLGLVLGDLYPLLHKSQVWFKFVRGVLRRENMGSEVRSSDLERGSSSNVNGEGDGVKEGPELESKFKERVRVAIKYARTIDDFDKFRGGSSSSSCVSIEEVVRPLKKQKTGNKGKEKMGSSVWADAETAMDYANELLTLGEMKEISSVPSHEMIKVLIEQLESEKQLVKQKDELLALAAQRMKVTLAKAVTAFQTTDEYNTILFQWYFKIFELLRRYLIKHGPGTDLEELDFEAINKEIEEDKAAQASAQTVILFQLIVIALFVKELPLEASEPHFDWDDCFCAVFLHSCLFCFKISSNLPDDELRCWMMLARIPGISSWLQANTSRASSAFIYFCAFNNASANVLGGFLAKEATKSLDFNPALKVVSCTLSSAVPYRLLRLPPAFLG
uniref:Uncharacterized protein n=1 Tax=Quercus lobata TaxID=97700 RepID=A0A7N2N732_QUELO